ncbi:MAG: helix-turn-helix transcriptional regulator [Woeseia sp.]|nr:helix-turn-helix transcriptional regulator [Woeseia sp.]NNL55175.1 helix-turn-helix transcriptional regulator [Woeseia sp.]
MALLTELLGRRWAVRVVWELRRGALTFRALQKACGGVSPSVLQSRLHELQRVGVIEKVPRMGYRLSASGESLYRTLEPLAEWAEARDRPWRRAK